MDPTVRNVAEVERTFLRQNHGAVVLKKFAYRGVDVLVFGQVLVRLRVLSMDMFYLHRIVGLSKLGGT